MRKKFRDVAALMVAVIVLFAGSMMLNDRLRQDVVRVSGDLHAVESNGTVIAISDAAVGVVGVVRDFSADNTFLFTFLVVAAGLLVLMLRT
jgi:hypothetical protein